MAEPLAVRYRGPNGAPLISVTQTLQVMGRICTDWFTPECAWRGQRVHTLTEEYDRGEALHIDEGLHGYLEAYAEFLASVRPTYHATELRVTNHLIGLGGRIDRVAEIWGQPGILDIKTSPPYAWHGLQLAAYNALRPTGARWGLYLQANGRYKLRPYDDPRDHKVFMHDLAQVRGKVYPNGDYWNLAA